MSMLSYRLLNLSLAPYSVAKIYANKAFTSHVSFPPNNPISSEPVCLCPVDCVARGGAALIRILLDHVTLLVPLPGMRNHSTSSGSSALPFHSRFPKNMYKSSDVELIDLPTSCNTALHGRYLTLGGSRYLTGHTRRKPCHVIPSVRNFKRRFNKNEHFVFRHTLLETLCKPKKSLESSSDKSHLRDTNMHFMTGISTPLSTFTLHKPGSPLSFFPCLSLLVQTSLLVKFPAPSNTPPFPNCPPTALLTPS